MFCGSNISKVYYFLVLFKKENRCTSFVPFSYKIFFFKCIYFCISKCSLAFCSTHAIINFMIISPFPVWDSIKFSLSSSGQEKIYVANRLVNRVKSSIKNFDIYSIWITPELFFIQLINLQAVLNLRESSSKNVPRGH